MLITHILYRRVFFFHECIGRSLGLFEAKIHSLIYTDRNCENHFCFGFSKWYFYACNDFSYTLRYHLFRLCTISFNIFFMYSIRTYCVKKNTFKKSLVLSQLIYKLNLQHDKHLKKHFFFVSNRTKILSHNKGKGRFIDKLKFAHSRNFY